MDGMHDDHRPRRLGSSWRLMGGLGALGLYAALGVTPARAAAPTPAPPSAAQPPATATKPATKPATDAPSRAAGAPASSSGFAGASASDVEAAGPGASAGAGAGAGAGEDGGLHVVVAPGARSLEPVAVPAVRCLDGAPRDVCATLTEVLRRDLLLSFLFKVLPPRSYLADPEAETIDAPSWKDWNNIGAKFLVKGEVRPAGAGVTVELRLHNVPVKEAIPVAHQTAAGVRPDGARRVAHRFANGVLAAITGTPGVFGTKLAYAAKVRPGVKAVAVMDMDGANRHGFAGGDTINMLPSWGLGGLLYTSFRGGKPDLYFGRRRFTRDEGHYRRVAVSRGGKIVASVSLGGQSDLWLLGKDGRRLRPLTQTAADEVSPVFSPDGSSLAFVSNAAGSPQIYMMGASGGAQTRLTYAGDYNYAPDWGPDGRILFSGMDDGRSDIFTVTTGAEISRLTQDQGSNRYATWSPDGRLIAFISTREGHTGVWLMSADGRYQLEVARGGGISGLTWQR